jgi:hypothetical protein
MGKPVVIGELTQQVIDALGLPLRAGMPILLGDQNQIHMETEHPDDYKKYFIHIEGILQNPDYVAKHPRKDSIEYIKVFQENNGEHVLVAVRISNNGTLFARTLFIMADEKVQKYRAKNALKSV